MAMPQLPDLRTREEIQSYLHGVADEVGVALNSPAVAQELDRRDQLAGFRAKFAVPTIGELLEEHERATGKLIHTCHCQAPTEDVRATFLLATYTKMQKGGGS